MTRISQFHFGSGPDADPANQWDTKRKLFSQEEECALPSVVLVSILIQTWGGSDPMTQKVEIHIFLSVLAKSY